MTEKNRVREERKNRRKPPIPYSRKEATRNERQEKQRRKWDALKYDMKGM